MRLIRVCTICLKQRQLRVKRNSINSCHAEYIKDTFSEEANLSGSILFAKVGYIQAQQDKG